MSISLTLFFFFSNQHIASYFSFFLNSLFHIWPKYLLLHTYARRRVIFPREGEIYCIKFRISKKFGRKVSVSKEEEENGNKVLNMIDEVEYIPWCPETVSSFVYQLLRTLLKTSIVFLFFVLFVCWLVFSYPYHTNSLSDCNQNSSWQHIFSLLEQYIEKKKRRISTARKRKLRESECLMKDQ